MVMEAQLRERIKHPPAHIFRLRRWPARENLCDATLLKRWLRPRNTPPPKEQRPPVRHRANISIPTSVISRIQISARQLVIIRASPRTVEKKVYRRPARDAIRSREQARW